MYMSEGHRSLLGYLVVASILKGLQPYKGTGAGDSDLSGVKFQIIPPGRLPRPAEVLAKYEDSVEWVEKDSDDQLLLRNLLVAENDLSFSHQSFCCFLILFCF